MKKHDNDLIWESYTTEDNKPVPASLQATRQGAGAVPYTDQQSTDADLSDINSVFRIDLYNGRSQPIIMTPEIEEDMSRLDGPNEGAVTTWMGEEHMYIKLNKH
jgi:hypothetical protein